MRTAEHDATGRALGGATRRPRPKVLVVVHSAKPAGAQLVALGEATALAERYDLVIAIGPGPLRARFVELGRVVRQPTRIPLWGASRRRWLLELARVLPDTVRLAYVARSAGVSAIVANSTTLVAPVLAGRLARVPVLVSAHEAPKSRPVRWAFRFHAALADTVIAISPWIAEHLRPARARILLNPPGIALPAMRSAEDLVPAATPSLLVVGTIDRHKRQHVAISTVAALRDGGVDATLQIVGRAADPAYLAELRALVGDLRLEHRVSFMGERSDAVELMRSADAVLVPAGEVTPLVLMEAMAVGTPVIAGRMGSIPDVVADGESGLLVAPGDAGAMAAAVRRLAAEPQLRGALVRGARARVEERFDARRSQRTVVEEVTRLIAARPGSPESSAPVATLI